MYQAAMYMPLMHSFTGIKFDFFFVFVETAAPYDLRIFKVTEKNLNYFIDHNDFYRRLIFNFKDKNNCDDHSNTIIEIKDEFSF
jgi:hypothetical protein